MELEVVWPQLLYVASVHVKFSKINIHNFVSCVPNISAHTIPTYTQINHPSAQGISVSCNIQHIILYSIVSTIASNVVKISK